MGVERKVLVVNADSGLVGGIEQGLADSAYKVEACPEFLSSLKEINFGDYAFIFVYIGEELDAPIVKDFSEMCRSKIIAITHHNPKEEGTWGNSTGKMPLRDYLGKWGAALVVHKDSLAGEEDYLSICLDSMFDEQQKDP